MCADGVRVTTTASLPLSVSHMPTAGFTALLAAPEGHRRTAVVALLHHNGANDVTTVSTAAQVREVILTSSPSDVVVIDGALTDAPVLPLIADLKAAGWRRVVLMTPRNDVPAVRAAIAAGVRSYAVARPDIALRIPEQSRFPIVGDTLSKRELEVLTLVSDGLSNKDIGERLELSALTVKSHLARMARKLGTGDRAHMVALAMRAGLVQ